MERDKNIGRILQGKYELVSQLGSGGMGAVYEAYHKLIDRRFAVKLLHAEYAKDENSLKRFQREATTTAAIGHENIVQVTDMGVTDEGEIFIVMELLEGRELTSVMNQYRQLSQGWACNMMVQVMGALEVVHRQGIVHRDIKPANIFLVDRFGRPPLVKLVDFGIAKVKATEEGLTSGLTRTGEVLGTPSYMSTEQARGETAITGATDIFACGVILYQMLTGELPFTGGSYIEVLMKILTEDFADPANYRPGIRPEIREAIYRSMEREPEDRCQDANGFLRVLEPFADPAALPEKSRDSLDAAPVSHYSMDQVTIDIDQPTRYRGETLPLDLAVGQVQPKSRKGAGWIAFFVVGLLVLALAGVGGWFFLGGEGDPQPGDPVSQGTADSSLVVGASTPAADAGSPLSLPERVEALPEKEARPQVRITVTPVIATVVVDGRQVLGEDGKFVLPVDGLGHKVEIRAVGFESYTRILVTSEATEFSVDLAAQKAPDPGKGESRKGSRRPAKAGDQGQKPDPEPDVPAPTGTGSRDIDEVAPW